MFSSITDFINGFRTDFVGASISLAYWAVAILFSLIIHECAHGYVALKCGDPTAKMLGRLTLNPAKHLDPIGTICMVFLHVGWAKPVPVNPRNFRNYRRDYILVSLAGIITNLLICMLSLLISALITKLVWTETDLKLLELAGKKDLALNIYQNSFNYFGQSYYSPAILIYSGYFRNLEDANVWMYVQRLFLMLAQMNLGLAVFNLLPVPPLDGFRFMDQFVFKGQLRLTPQTMQYIHIGFLVVCMSGMLSGLLTTVNSTVFGWLCQLFALII